MQVKTSLILSEELIKAIAQQAGEQKNLSEFIESAVWAFISHNIRSEQENRDLEIINNRADRLNEEAEDVLAYQVELRR